MQIRRAQIEDAVAACEVLRRSIVELCTADHANDPVRLKAWLRNKTPEQVAAWITASNNFVFVAVDADSIVGVGAVTSKGEITLNYVSPVARFQGISKALLKRLETAAQECGNTVCSLTTTKTARRFYAAQGYENHLAADERAAPQNPRMTKLLR
jgi:GNAT superfamily N-acetyltransferase